MFTVPSGGNRYNACLTEALHQIGAEIEVMEWEAFEAEIRPGIFWIDTLYMEQWAQTPTKHPGQQVGLLVHHLESLYPPPGMDSDAYFVEHENAILKQFDAFLVTSPFTKEYLIRRGFGDQAILVVPPAMHQVPDVQISAEPNLRALMVANLIERKGILAWLEVLEEKEEKPGNFELTIIGSDELEAEYAAACKEKVANSPLLKKSVRLTGPLPHEEVWKYYPASNLFISAAHMETYGMALQEAVAVGLPILALRGGHVQAHVKEGENGYLFGELGEMAGCFVRLSGDVEERRKLVEGARASKPDPGYDWGAAGRLYVELVRDYAAGLRSGRSPSQQ